ncbi:MAG: helix-turn-helix domain-containing protein [Acidimicrobiales bacterium]
MTITREGLAGRIRHLREQEGLTQHQLAERVSSLDQPKISKIETGERGVSSLELVDLAAALGIHPGDLLDDRPIGEFVGMAARSGTYRERSTVEHAIARTEAAVRLHRTLARLGYGTAAAPAVDPPAAVKGSPGTQGKTLAAWVRSELGLGDDPIDDLIGLAEEGFGLNLLIDHFGDGFDGLCVHDDGFALGVVNSAAPASRQRFTIAHELCHHIVNDLQDGLHVDESLFSTGGDPSEVRANAFAAYLLMPPGGVRDVVGQPFRVEMAARLQYQFGASLQSVAFHLRNLGLIDDRWREQLRATPVFQLAEMAGCRAQYEADDGERRRLVLPARLQRLALDAFVAGDLGVSPVAELRGESDQEFGAWAEENLGVGR